MAIAAAGPQARAAAEEALAQEREHSKAQPWGLVHTILDTKMRALVEDLAEATAAGQPVRCGSMAPA